jgi:hypothetical protein
MLTSAILPLTLAAAPPFDPQAQYRLTTEFQGECVSLDVVNDATDDKLILAPSAEVSGQLWQITPLGNGHHRLTTMFKGPGKSLDVVNDETDDALILAKTADVSGQRWRITRESGIGAPPPHLKMPAFYKKYLDAEGIPIVSSNKVPDAALHRVRHTMRQMLARVPAARQRLVANKVKIAIMAKSEKTTDIPEYKVLGPHTADGRHIDTVRGFGATLAIPVSSCAEENVMCHHDDPAKGEDIFVHEFAHTMHRLGLEPAFGSTFTSELASAHAHATANKLWANTYAATDINEYFAEGVQAWFNLNLEGPVGGNGIHNHVNTRTELKGHDSRLHALLSKYFPSDDNNCSCTPVGGGSTSASAPKAKTKGKTLRKFRIRPNP